MPQPAQRSQQRSPTGKAPRTPALQLVPASRPSLADLQEAEAKESEAAAAAYRIFERLGAERTIPLTAQTLRAERPQHYRATPATLERRLKEWQAKYYWRDRAHRYDQQVEAQERLDAERARKKMNETQAGVGEQLTRMVGRRITELLRIDQAIINATMQAQDLLAQGHAVPANIVKMMNSRPSLTFGSTAITELFRHAIEIERLARGASTENVQTAASAAFEAEAATGSAPEEDPLARATIFYYPQPDQPPADEVQVLSEPPAQSVDADESPQRTTRHR